MLGGVGRLWSFKSEIQRAMRKRYTAWWTLSFWNKKYGQNGVFIIDGQNDIEVFIFFFLFGVTSVSVFDGLFTSSTQICVIVQDMNDNNPIFTQTSYEFTCDVRSQVSNTRIWRKLVMCELWEPSRGRKAKQYRQAYPDLVKQVKHGVTISAPQPPRTYTRSS